MRLLRALAYASATGAWVVIVVGGYVSATGSGLGCGDLILCGEAPDPTAAAIETAHRIVAWIEGFLVLAMFLLVWLRYRPWRVLRAMVTGALLLVVAQSLLGILAVATELHPAIVTMHLGIAAAFLAVTVLIGAKVHGGPPAYAHPGTTPGGPTTAPR